MELPPTYPSDVSCSTVHQALRDDALDAPDVQAHVEVCPACAELVADGGALGRELVEAFDSPAPVEPSLRSAVRQRVTADGRTLARWSTRRRATLAALAVAGAGGLTWALAPRADAAVYPVDRMVLMLGALIFAASSSLTLALRPLHRPPPAPWLRRAVWLGALGVPLALSALPEAHADHPASVMSGPEPLLVCASIVMAFVGLALVGLRALDRRVRASPAALAWFAVVGSATGQLVLQLHCPVTDPGHLVVSHALVGAIAAVALAVAPWRRAPGVH